MKKKIETKETLNKIVNDARSKLMIIQDREEGELNAALYRKCFKGRNNYSCPKKPSDYWWVYVKILSVDGRWVSALSFQDDKCGQLTYKIDKAIMGSHYRSDGYKEISDKEFERTLNKFKDKMELK